MSQMRTAPTLQEPAPAVTWRDEAAYLLPMASFLLFTFLAGKWPSTHMPGYVIKTLLAGGLIAWFWKRYTRIRWDYWGLGILFGILGIIQWVGVEELLLKFWPNYPRIPGADVLDPFERIAPGGPLKHFASAWGMWGFILFRWAGAVLVVPLMEELFWRDFLWRTIIAPNNFKLAHLGEWDVKAFFLVVLFCTSVHPQWITALVWCFLIGGLLLYTRSLGACIIAHAITNFLLGAWVQWTGKWYYW